MPGNNQSCVPVNGRHTDMFSVSIGVKQGSVLSPTLFSLYINDLVQEIYDLQCGIDIDGTILSLRLYADDITLISADEHTSVDAKLCRAVVQEVATPT